MPANPNFVPYAKAIAEAKARLEEHNALNLSLKQQADGCAEFFQTLGVFLSQEMQKANEGLAESGFNDRFDGLYAAKPPEHRMIISFGGVSDTREITLDLGDKNYPTVRIKDAADSPTGTLQFVLKDVGVGLQAFTTEGGGTANWSIPLSGADVAARTVENIIDGLFR